MKNNFMFSTQKEKLILRIMVFISMLSPMKLQLKMNYKYAKYMAKNPGHSFARNMVSMVEEREKNE